MAAALLAGVVCHSQTAYDVVLIDMMGQTAAPFLKDRRAAANYPYVNNGLGIRALITRDTRRRVRRSCCGDAPSSAAKWRRALP